MYGHYSTMAEHELLGKESACGMAERDPDRDSLDGDSLEGEWRSEGEERTISVEHGPYSADCRSAGGLTAPLSPSTPRSYIMPTDRRGLIVSTESVTNPNNQTIQSSPIRQNHYQQQQQQQYYQVYESQERGDDIGRCLEPVDRLLRVENARRSPKRRLTPGDLTTVTSLGEDSAPIGPDLIAAHRNTSTPQQQRRHLSDRVDNTHEPTRRKECMFFVDLDDLPAPTQSSNGTFKCSKRPAQRSESSDSQRSVYLYIDLENGGGGGSSGQAGRSRGHSSGSHAALARAGFGRQGMSASYHGQSTLENGDSDDYHYDYHDYDDDDEEASCSVSRGTLTKVSEGRGSSGRRGSSGFLTMTGTEEPQQVANNRPPTLPPQLSSRLHALELHRRRRRNHSIGGVEMSSATATARSQAPAAGTAMTSTCSAPKIAPRTTLSRGGRASSAAAATTTAESSPPASSRSRNNRGRGDFAASPSAANMTSKQQQHQQSRSSARRISTGGMSSPGGSRVGGSGGGGSSSSYSGRRLVVGNTRRVSDTLQTRSVTRRAQRRSDVTTPVTSLTTPPPPARSGSLQPQQRQQQQPVSEPSQRLTGSIARRSIPTSVTEKQQQLQRRSFLRAHSGGYAAGGTAQAVGQLSTVSASRSQTGVAAGSGSRSRQQVIGDRNVTDTRRDNVPATATCDSDNDNGSDFSSSCRSSTAAATATVTVNKRANVSWSRGTESVNQLTADFMNLLVSGHNADVIIETDDGELSCHSAILCARSEFFRDLLTSPQPAIPVSTVPNSSTKRILLQSHSSASVRFLLAHLYTASVQIPDTGLDLFDLLALANRVCHSPLVRLLDSAVRTRLCHMFHKPCPVCIPGVFRCLAASIDLHLTSLTDRCVSWLTQHRAVVWSCPSAVDLLPQQLCVWTFNTTFQLSEGCVLDILSDCSRLMTSLTSSPSNDTSQQQHQAELEMKSESSSLAVVGEMAGKLVNDAVVLASRCLSSLIASDSFMALSDSPTNCDLLERHLLAAAEIQNAADAVVCVDVLYQLQTVPSADWCQKFVSLISSLSDTCSARSAVTVNKFTATPSMSASVHLPSASYQDDAADELAEMTALDRSYYDFRPCTEVTATASYTTTPSVSSSQARHQTTAPIMSASFSCVTMNTEQRAANDRVREEPGIASAMSRSESFTICKHE